ncbi:ATP-binding cassette domain-containing protein [Pseudoalteromonas sp. MMG010]|uniref:ATP-binding cassette domain-containing protein n=1 Tax=Pseudoalteromonas sp. MMG010 TaxID=2822685 RepID=UPI001B39F8F8|nr:ATP-binding cassette domain-containing protein [Pseudoalteromonas sp. MMG010]MBQ4834207.1 ATP-binding cassette domain-containing protein [Pseudoalteromonas sp. MMG010]
MNNKGGDVKFIKFTGFNGYLAEKKHSLYPIHNLTWQVNEGEHWLLLGANGAGKSALSFALTGAAKSESGEFYSTFNHIEIVSSDIQKQMLKEELDKESPTLNCDFLYSSTPNNIDISLSKSLINLFNFEHLLQRYFRDLSTGETRKLLLIKAISSRPELLVLDEPFDGLDTEMVKTLHALLQTLKNQVTFVFVLNRYGETPHFVSHYGYVNKGELQHTIATPNAEQRDDLLKLLHLERTPLVIPPPNSNQVITQKNVVSPLVTLKEAKVTYADRVIFSNLNWQINKHQHWQLTGSNGSGKTCLLNLITGDNPQCYSNDINVFGFQRGSGESIWDIKQHIGYISNALHMDYRVSVSALNTIISGFFDSIGLYQKPTDEHIVVAKKWLALLGLADKQNISFTQLSYGDQRMLLIARAMVKHPTLLILDEPCLGLDEPNRQRVLLLIEKICAAKSSTVVYVNHHSEDKITGIEHYLSMNDY